MASYAAIREPESLKRPLWFSLAFHGALVLLFVGNAIYSRTGNDWGGPGGAITVGVVGSLPAVPLPTPEVVTPSRVVDESKGLYKAEPPAAPPIVPPDALPIPKFDKVKPPKYVTRPSKVLENPKPPPPNAVPYGGGGTPTVPTTSFAMGPGTAAQAGMGFEGPGAGNFGARFSWYVEAVQRKVTENWLKYEVDPGIREASRVYLTFDIARDGHPSNVQIEQSSGVPSLDQSAVRALQRIDTFGPLPSGYSGSKVSVEFWFDYKR